jgi:hypothetical protein
MDPAKSLASDAKWFGDQIKQGVSTMFASFQTRQILVSVVGALVFASLAITTAAPIFPMA